MRKAFIFILFALLSSCVEPFEAHVPDGARPIVIDGLITDQPGPYFVDIFRSSKLTSPYEEREYEAGAIVTILDDEGASEQLTEVKPGHYQTNALQGMIGKTYHLNVKLSDGSIYESTPDKMIPAGDFSNLRTTFNQVVDGDHEDFKHPSNGFNVYLDSEISPEQEGRVRWRWTGTYEIQTYPELRVKLKTPPGAVLVFLPDPPPCSGYIVPTKTPDQKIQAGPCTCCFCWVSQYNGTPLISDKKAASNKINNVLVGYVPANSRYLFRKYHLEVEQMSVSENVYAFWKQVEKQAKQSSDLFQTPSAATEGNISLISENGSPVVGVFGASAIVKHSFEISRDLVPYTIPAMDTMALSCVDAYRYSTSTQPAFW